MQSKSLISFDILSILSKHIKYWLLSVTAKSSTVLGNDVVGTLDGSTIFLINFIVLVFAEPFSPCKTHIGLWILSINKDTNAIFCNIKWFVSLYLKYLSNISRLSYSMGLTCSFILVLESNMHSELVVIVHPSLLTFTTSPLLFIKS